MKVVFSVDASTSMIVSGARLGRAFSRMKAERTCRRTPGSRVPSRSPRERSVESAHAFSWTVSTAITSESPAAGSHVAVPMSRSAPPPGADQGTLCCSVSIACSQLALVPSQGSVRAWMSISTGPDCTLPSVSNRATIRPERKVSVESGLDVPAVSVTVATAG